MQRIEGKQISIVKKQENVITRTNNTNSQTEDNTNVKISESVRKILIIHRDTFTRFSFRRFRTRVFVRLVTLQMVFPHALVRASKGIS